MREMTASPGDHIVDADWLEDAIASSSPNLRIVDMRGYVNVITNAAGEQIAEYMGARADYEAGHIPGAIYLDWTQDIVDPDSNIPVQVASAERMSEVLGNAGIGDSDLIVAYDAHPSMQFATRLWWALRYYGNKNVRVLQGGWTEWRASNRPISLNVPVYPGANFHAVPNSDWLAGASEVLEMLKNEGFTLIDARDAGQYSGSIRRGLRGGHIPGAINIPREMIFRSPAVMKPISDLRAIFEESGIDLSGTNRLVAYCNGGVAATSVLFALSMLGCTKLCNYDGSWNEWNMNPALPVA